MKPFITTALAAAVAILITACDNKPPASASEGRVKALEDEIARLKASPPAAPKPVGEITVTNPVVQSATPPEPNPFGELTRELAAQLLNKHLSTPHVDRIQFQNGGEERAIKDGVIIRQNNLDYLTKKGYALTKGMVKQDGVPIVGELTITPPISESVEVTGVSIPIPNLGEVEYTTYYTVPPEAHEIFKYIYTGRTAKALFQKYDDGWRVDRELR